MAKFIEIQDGPNELLINIDHIILIGRTISSNGEFNANIKLTDNCTYKLNLEDYDKIMGEIYG